jgi:hypothetical protein
MARKRIYITVKTYPSISKKYDELVCTAGIQEDGSWIRLYPLPFRKLDNEQKYKKYQWIEADVEKNTSDIRMESFKVSDTTNIKIFSEQNKSVDWEARKRIIFKSETVYTNRSEIIRLTKKPLYKSLVIFKPSKIMAFNYNAIDREWPKEKLSLLKAKASHLSLFQTQEEVISEFGVVQKLPYRFSYRFEDDAGQELNLMIEDWEIGTLYFNCLRYSEGVEEKALEKVRKKYWDEFMKKDLYFFLGTRKSDHLRARNPFSIVGVFYPPKTFQQELF